jgi:hypothetical protein
MSSLKRNKDGCWNNSSVGAISASRTRRMNYKSWRNIDFARNGSDHFGGISAYFIAISLRRSSSVRSCCDETSRTLVSAHDQESWCGREPKSRNEFTLIGGGRRRCSGGPDSAEDSRREFADFLHRSRCLVLSWRQLRARGPCDHSAAYHSGCRPEELAELSPCAP